MSETKVYQVRVENLAELQGRIAGLNKRAHRLGVFPIVLAVGAATVEKIEDGRRPSGFREVVRIEVSIVGSPPRLPGWTFAAILSHEDGGTLIRSVPGATVEGELVRFRDATPLCDHCKTNRRRNETFVVRREADRALLQVGRNCLADFLGHDDPHSLAAAAELQALAGELVEGAGEEGFGGCGSGRSAISLETFIGVTVAAIRAFGWLSRTKARESGRDGGATADLVFSECVRPASSSPVVPEILADDNIEGERLLGVASKYFEITKPESLGDYEHNLRVVVLSGYVTSKSAGLAASLVGFARRLEGQAAERALGASGVLKHVGTVGERVELVLTLVRATESETEFGLVTYAGFRDAAGNRLVWKASGSLHALRLPTTEGGRVGESRARIGETYEVLGTVSRHSQDRREPTIPETWLKRCVLREPGVAAVLAATKKADAAAKRAAKKAERAAAKASPKTEPTPFEAANPRYCAGGCCRDLNTLPVEEQEGGTCSSCVEAMAKEDR